MRSPVNRIQLLRPLMAVMLMAGAFVAGSVSAAETLESVLAVAAKQQRLAIDYREIRHLQLLSEPWQAAGQMLMIDNSFAIEQHTPQRQLLVANRTRFWLFLPERNIRRSGMLTTPMAKKSFGLLKPLMSGDREALEQAFAIRFSATDYDWLLEMKPKEPDATAYKLITVRGQSGQSADYMKTELPDGDFSEWQFKQLPFAPGHEARLQQLLKEARGF